MYWNLNFITKEQYTKHVKEFFYKIVDCEKAQSLNEFNKNIIDPIKLTFSYFTIGEDINRLVSAEVSRQQDKSINNNIGYFHQNIFQYIDGWEVPKQGFDIVNKEKNIFVEMKNKHNTMNSNSSQKTYMIMQDKIIEDPCAKCMLVEIIAKKSQDIPWRVSLNGIPTVKENIRRVSIDKFYEIATGDSEAFRKIIEWLPITLKDLAVQMKGTEIENDVIEELEKEGSFFKGLYNLAFNDYIGFKDLKFEHMDILGDDFKD